MAVLQECPVCHQKQAKKNKKCRCGKDLDSAKNAGKVRWWIQYRLPGGKQRKEPVGYSLEDAKAAEGKRRSQKKEGRIFDMLPESKITFNELTEWYMDLSGVKKLAYYHVLKINLESFNKVFGEYLVNNIKPVDLENYQLARKDEGKSDSYIDQEVGAARGMLRKAWDNDKVSGDSLKPFKRTKKLLKKGSNARDRVLSQKEIELLKNALPYHARCVFITALLTGMRMKEISCLTWDQVDLKNRKIELEASQTKDREKRSIPISETLFKVLDSLPRGLHDNHVFLYKNKPLRSIRASLKKACEKVGIPYGRKVKDGVTMHDLRHCYNTYMRRAGVHDTVTMDITGHATLEMFGRYNTVDEKEKAEAVKRMESLIFNDENKEHKEG